MTRPEPGALRVELAQVLLAQRTFAEVLDLIVEVVPLAVAGADAASVTVRTNLGQRFETSSASASLVREIDDVQYRTSRGPCVTASATGNETVVEVPAAQWPEFSAVAQSKGVRTVWSIPLTVGEGAFGAMNIYSLTGSPWETASADAARVLAWQAAILVHNAAALADAEVIKRHLSEALATRTVIGQAQGILMARQHIDADEAFAVLRRASQRVNRKLREIAEDLVEANRRAAHATAAGPRPQGTRR